MSDSQMADVTRLRLGGLLDAGAGLVMALGHRALARRVVELADLNADDRVVDIGCGPGNAARAAAVRAAHVVGIDPSPGMLRVARWLASRRPHADRLTFQPGMAEALPVETGTATVAWATASFHHWSDRLAGLKEAHRILSAGGRLLLVERVVRSGRRRQNEHGLARDDVNVAEDQLRIAGFSEVKTDTVAVGRRRYFVVRGTI